MERETVVSRSISYLYSGIQVSSVQWVVCGATRHTPPTVLN